MAKKSKNASDNVLFQAIYTKNCEKLVELAAQNKSKKTPFSFKDVLIELCKIAEENKKNGKKEANKSNEEKEECVDSMWRMLSELVIEKTEGIFLSNTSRKSKEHSDVKMCAEVSLLIQAAIDLVLVIFGQGMEVTKGLLHMVVFLNRVMFEIPSTMENVKNSIALMCEKMYHLKYVTEDSEHIIFNTLIYLLRRSLSKKAVKKDVKRVYALREIVPKVLAMGEVNTSAVWCLFKQCAVSSIYLSMPEGQKMLSFILTVDVDHIAEIHHAIKKRLPSCSLSQGSAYGKVYYEAWSSAVKKSSEALKNELEIMCLQDIVMTAVRSRQKSVVLVLRKLLAQFHCQKKEIYVAKMLYFLYHPIIWRYLKNPDGLFRANTAQIFLDVFPLEDPDVKLVATDMELNEQLLMIKDLLLDDFPIVRSASVIGLCIAMSVNWELFPEEMLKTYFKIIVNDLSCDSSSSDVRCAVAKGLKVLLENPLTIPTLQSVLPKISNLFHDVSDNVRVAFCQLLLRVKKICGIKYYDIVPVEHMLARMEEDKVIAKLLVNLLHNSYFPRDQNPNKWLSRCLDMLMTNRAASRVFFQFVPNYIGLEATASFMVQAVRNIHNFVKTSVQSRRASLPNVFDKENNVNEINRAPVEASVGLNDPNLVSGLLDAIAIMWLSTLNDLEKPENKIVLKLIVAKLAKCLGDLSLYYKDTPVWQSVYYLSSFMPSHAIPSLASLCFLRLKTLDPKTSVPEDYITLLECLCNQNEASSVLLLLKEWILDGFKEECRNSPLVKRSRIKAKELNQPILAVRMINAMLDHRSCQKVLLSKHIEDLRDMLSLTENVKIKVKQCVEVMVTVDEGLLLAGMLYAMEKIAVILHSEEEYDSIKYIEELVAWVQENLLQTVFLDKSLTFSSKRSSRTPKKIKASSSIEGLAMAICKDLCVIIADMSLAGLIDTKSFKFIKFSLKLLTSGSGEHFLAYVSPILCKYTAYGIYRLLKEKDNILYILPECFSKIIQCLNDEDFLERLPVTEWKDIQLSLATCLIMLQHYGELKEIVSDIMSLITKTIVHSIFKDMDSWENIEKECNPFEKIPIPKCGTFLLNIIRTKPKLIMYFVQQLHKHFSVTESSKQSWVACYVIVMNIWDMKNQSKNINKEMHILVNKMESELKKFYPLQMMNVSVLKCSNDHIIPDEKENMEVEEIEEMNFEEHCRYEYKKLRELMAKKAQIM